MVRELDDGWADWIRLNVGRGCDKDGIFRVLLDEGFSHDQIVAEMNYEPAVDLALVTNPLTWRRPADEDGFSQRVFLDEDKLYLPGAYRIPTYLAEIYLLDDFLNQQECEKLATLIKSRLSPSVVGGLDDEVTTNSYRTSSACNLNSVYNPLVREIEDRICRTIGIDASYSESIQGHYYPADEEFKAHADYYEQDQLAFADPQGQRTYTFMVYLTDAKEGGETDFVKLGVAIKPKRGQALMWSNLNAQGISNPYALHRTRPVVRGSQWIITKCFRAHGVGPMYIKDRTETTRTGIIAGHAQRPIRPAPSIPDDLFADVASGLWTRDNKIISRRGGQLVLEMIEGFIDDLILTEVLPAREAAALSEEEFNVLRASVRTELFSSEQIRQLLTERAKETLKDLREQGGVVGLTPLAGPNTWVNAAESTDVRFVLVAHARTGSNLLASALEQHPQVVMFGELFHDNGTEDPTNYYHSSADRGDDGAEFLDRLYQDDEHRGRAVGFKMQYGQASVHAGAQAAWRFLAEHTGIRIIQLERANLLAAYVSLKTAIQTGEWIRSAGSPVKNEALTFRLDPTECLGYFQMIERYTQRARTVFRDHPMLHLVYEHDLCESFEASLRRVQEFLGVSDFPVPPRTHKQSDYELSERIENFAALADYFADSPYAKYFTMR
jgi:LPS sulfotransferase NodH